MPLLLLKLTLLLTIPLACLPLMRRTSPAMRHLVCAGTLACALLLPFTLLLGRNGIALPLSFVFRSSALARATSPALHAGGPSFWFALWATGTAFLLARLALGYYWVRRILRLASPGDEFSMAPVSVPMVTGLFTPVILLPLSADSWPVERRTAALRHERAHMDRKDLWTNLMVHLVCALYWFHPFVWAVARLTRREQEAACDDAVLRSGLEPAIYAEALIASARQLTSTSLIGCPMLTQKTLSSRIARLLDGSLPRISSTEALQRAALLLAATFGCIALLNAQADEANTSQVVLKVGNGVSAPQVLFRADPVYTDEAKAAGVEGVVLLSVVVGTDGLARDINIVKTLEAGLDVRAVEAVQKWRFHPGMLNGSPVPVRATIEINFRLL